MFLPNGGEGSVFKKLSVLSHGRSQVFLSIKSLPIIFENLAMYLPDKQVPVASEDLYT